MLSLMLCELALRSARYLPRLMLPLLCREARYARRARAHSAPARSPINAARAGAAQRAVLIYATRGEHDTRRSVYMLTFFTLPSCRCCAMLPCLAAADC